MSTQTAVGTGRTGRQDRRASTWRITSRQAAVLRSGTALFAAGFVVHNIDHLRRGLDAITGQVFAGGTVISFMALTVFALVLLRHRLAPAAALWIGAATAVGVSASHLLPRWSAFSDAFPGGHVDGWSWFAVLFEVAGAVVLAGCGWYAGGAKR